ncbi:MAG: bifunctional 4-hydroxy-3-methylbut-2-enyl diphosphate reductase/30S ribosomal protein S1 [Clostridia bacterium]|nr:bifunctional 4-hydroxy-3-methylbut-2-enyl diphosphate reductase/30S ribosomal protein S1 [Clostridia bacterium]
MQVILAKHAGFCFGVKKALAMAEEAAQNYEQPIYSLGPLIHNQQVVKDLESKGVLVANGVGDVPEGVLVIRSHGVSPEVLKEAEDKGLTLVDATCPFVKKAQQAARKLNEEGYQVVVVGDRNHPEVAGIVGWTNNRAIVVESPAEALNLPIYEKIGVVAQTTQPVSNFNLVVEVLKGKAKEVEAQNTICHATGDHQNAAVELARQVDVMLVIGGANSANTLKLARLCRDTGVPTYHIETAQDIQCRWFDNLNKIGITAGASTPDWIIEEVKNKMTELKDNNSEENKVGEGGPVEENREATKAEEANQDFKDMAEALQVMDVRRGDVVTGTVVKVSDDEVLVDIGAKCEGVVPVRELSCCLVTVPKDYIKEGDKVEVVVLRVEDIEGRIIVSKQKADARKAMVGLKEAYEQGQLVKGKVTEVVKGGLLVDLGVRAFVPASLVDRGYVEHLEQLVGQTIEAKIIEYNQEKGRVVLSRKVVVEEEAKRLKAETMANLQEGQMRKGIVRRLTNFGAFIDLGGIDGLLHVSEMAWHRVNHPSEVVKVGDEVEVMILKVENGGERISLGLKQVIPSPWTIAAEKYKPGSVVKGNVVRIAPFGAFVELEPGLDGLIHLSQLSDRRVAKADDVVSVGQEVQVKVLDVKEEEHRISLSLKDVAKDEEAKEASELLTQQTEEPKVTIGDAVGTALADAAAPVEEAEETAADTDSEEK